MATELATRPPAFIDGKTLAANDMRLNILSGGGGATPLQSRSGVRPSGGSPGLVAALATPVMKVRVNAGIADVASTSVTGGFYRVSWDQVDLDIDVSSAQARTDLIIVEVVDTGTSAATGKVRVLKGSSGAGRPSNLVVNAHWFSLAAVAVRVNAEGTGNIRAQDVTPEAPYAVAPGAPIPVRSTAERTTLEATAFPGLHVTRLDQGGRLERWVSGTTWDPYPLATEGPISWPVAALRQNVTQSGLATGWQSITFDAEDIDTAGGHSTSTNTSRWTCPAGQAGTYAIEGGVAFGSMAADLLVNARIIKNGVGAFGATGAYGTYGGAGGTGATTGMKLITLVPGDYVELQGYVNSGGWSTVVFDANACTLNLHRIR